VIGITCNVAKAAISISTHHRGRGAIADPDMSEATKADMAAWTGRIAGALTDSEFRHALASAGLIDVEIHETHRVHEHAAAAIIRAHKAAEAEVER